MLTREEEKWWLTEYAFDIAANLKENEKLRLPFRGISPQIYSRKYLIEWLMEIVDIHFGMSQSTLHLAAYLLDSFMDNHSISENELQLVAASCFLVAAKFEEKEVNVPRVSQVNTCLDTQRQRPLAAFMNTEILILQFNQWLLNIPTVANYIDYYSMECVALTDTYTNTKVQLSSDNGLYESILGWMKRYLKYFIDIMLIHGEFTKIKPSLKAAACIGATRACLFLSPKWPNRLVCCTQYSSSQIAATLKSLMKILEKEKSAYELSLSIQGCRVKSPDGLKTPNNNSKRRSSGAHGASASSVFESSPACFSTPKSSSGSSGCTDR